MAPGERRCRSPGAGIIQAGSETKGVLHCQKNNDGSRDKTENIKEDTFSGLMRVLLLHDRHSNR